VIAFLAFVACLAPSIVFEEAWNGLARGPIHAAIRRSLEEVASISVMIMVLVVAARRAGWSVRDGFGLIWPHWRYILIGLGLLVANVVLDFALDDILPAPEEIPASIEEFRAARGNPISLALFSVSTVIIAPVWEEIAYRGFLLRGWIGSPLGVAGAIALTSLLFAATHLQFNAHAMVSLFFSGFLFGVMRWISGSIVPSIVMHAAWNTMVLIMLMLDA
jgi:membrane protease YdiL (CAAX protease family)